tara:strand:+ start:707 stop:1084 length:378 start_codon:yes stop_codon:yes gene_type:complete
MAELKDWLNSINLNKKNILEEDPDAKYPAYVVNRCLSGTIDSIMYANEMNMHPNLDKDMQYTFMLNGLRKRKRFSPWLKQEKINDLDLVKKYYGYSNEKARQALRILTPEQLKYIRKKMDVGGVK